MTDEMIVSKFNLLGLKGKKHLHPNGTFSVWLPNLWWMISRTKSSDEGNVTNSSVRKLRVNILKKLSLSVEFIWHRE